MCFKAGGGALHVCIAAVHEPRNREVEFFAPPYHNDSSIFFEFLYPRMFVSGSQIQPRPEAGHHGHEGTG